MKPPFLDRRVFFAASMGGVSSWTLPYLLPTTAPVVVVNAVTGARIPSTRPATNRVAVATPVTVPVYVGLPFASEVELSPPVLVRRDLGIAETRGRLTLREYVFHTDADSQLEVSIARLKRTAETRRYTGKPYPQVSDVRVSVLHDSPTSLLTVRSVDHFPLRLTGGQATFTFAPQSRAY